MQAVVFEKTGEARAVLGFRDVSEPAPGPGQALVRVEASPIHPADFSFVRGTYRVRPVFPQVAGLSGAGLVVAAGAGVDVRPGTRVAFRAPGAWAELVVVPKERLYPVPDAVESARAAEFAVNPITAWGLLEVANVHAGDWVLLTAASSAVAALVAALAHARGIHVLGVTREASLTELRPDVVGVAESTPDLAARVRDATHGVGVTALIDCVGGSLVTSLFPTLKKAATVVAYGTLSPEPAAVRNADLVYGNLSWRGFGIDHWLSELHPEEHALMLEALWDGIRRARLPLPVQAEVALRDFDQALALAASGGRGKVHFVPRAAGRDAA
jgi:NADPH:quinone reductase-like Zn-dependent oxidoreductase